MNSQFKRLLSGRANAYNTDCSAQDAINEEEESADVIFYIECHSAHSADLEENVVVRGLQWRMHSDWNVNNVFAYR